MIESTELSEDVINIFLAELKEKRFLKIPGCRVAGHTEDDGQRIKILKTLVYRDLVSFSVDHNKPGYYVFVDRNTLGRF